MSAALKERESQSWFQRLYQPSYRIVDAARYAKSHPSTVASWHYRGTPVLPGHPKGQPLSYLELVEVAFVAFFRNNGVPMYRIREARDFCSKRLYSERPFTEYAFKTEGMHILMDFDQASSDDPFAQFISMDQSDRSPGERYVVAADLYGQLAWEVLMGNKFAEFDYEYELALVWHPAGMESLVVIDPRNSFGAPTVEGLPTWVIKGRYIAGELMDEIVEDFDVSERAIVDGLMFERISEGDIAKWLDIESLTGYRDSLLG